MTQANILTRYGLLIVSVVALATVFVFSPKSALSQSSSVSILGYAWSDTIGWIDLNCANTDVCATRNFGLSIASDGTISGYAWSDTIGWISANASDLTGCPSGTCAASMSSHSFRGWLRALAGSTAQSGGWDGFISLSGSNYGITLLGTNFSGYAWGDTNVGWVDFSHAGTVVTSTAPPPTPSDPPPCAPGYYCDGNQIFQQYETCATRPLTVCDPPTFCSSGASVCITPSLSVTQHLKAIPSLVRRNGTTKLSWAVTGATNCTVSGNGDSWSGLSGAKLVSSPIIQQTVYTLTCSRIGGGVYTETATVNLVPVWVEM